MTVDYSEPDALRTPIKAVRTKCLDCTGNQPKEVRLCPAYHCALWPYRFGRRPTQAVYTDKPPRYEAPSHLPVIDDAGRIVPPEERESRASSGKTRKDGKP